MTRLRIVSKKETTSEMATLMAVLSWESDKDCASITQEVEVMIAGQNWRKEKLEEVVRADCSE